MKLAPGIYSPSAGTDNQYGTHCLYNQKPFIRLLIVECFKIMSRSLVQTHFPKSKMTNLSLP